MPALLDIDVAVPPEMLSLLPNIGFTQASGDVDRARVYATARVTHRSDHVTHRSDQVTHRSDRVTRPSRSFYYPLRRHGLRLQISCVRACRHYLLWQCLRWDYLLSHYLLPHYLPSRCTYFTENSLCESL